ncbi:MAG: c-type cytochrome [Gemmatimonadota bacterium]
MRTNLPAIVFRAAVCSLVVLAACSKGDSPSSEKEQNRAGQNSGDQDDMGQRNFGGDKTLAVAGRAIFLSHNCYGCHGGLAGGAMGPSLRDTTWKYGGSDSAIYHSIHDGRPLGMPPWAGRLDDRQIGSLIQYIRSIRTRDEPQFFFATGSGDSVARALPNAAPPARMTPVPMAAKKPKS